MNILQAENISKYQIKVLRKVFRLFELFNEDVEELSAAQITQMLKYNQTTVFRIISNLEEEGYLDKNPDNGKYRLGMRLFSLGNLVKPYQHLKSVARPFLQKLNQQSGETVHLAVLHHNQTLYVDKIESNHTIRVVVSRVGHKLPAHCSGLGKVLLASMPLEESKAAMEETGLLPFTKNTITTWNKLLPVLETVRRQGFAVDDGEIELGLSCVAAPILVDGRATAALSISAPRERFEPNGDNFTRMVQETARDLGEALQDSMNRISVSKDRT